MTLDSQKVKHTPVLLNEVITFLNPQHGQLFIDCTLGGGGHFRAIRERILPDGKILGIDVYEKSIKAIEAEKLSNVILVKGNFKNLKKIAEENGFEKVDGILMDLGFSSIELEESGLGLSFQKDEPLDMRMDERLEITAADIINNWKEGELVKIFSELGEERFSKRIAKAIVENRRKIKIETSLELAELIRSSVPARFRIGRIHPATRIFQALRIVVNNEFENLKKALEDSLEILNTGGKIAAISFHSGEDRIVKFFFRDNKDKFEILTKKPAVPSNEEIERNPRSRSAKLRVSKFVASS